MDCGSLTQKQAIEYGKNTTSKVPWVRCWDFGGLSKDSSVQPYANTPCGIQTKH